MTSPPHDQPPSAPSPLRNEDREAAVQRLQEAYADELISHEEMDQRLEQVLTATTSDGLATAMRDLPPERPGTTSTIAAASGRIKRRGPWQVPRHLKIESAFGKVRLDLSRAVITYPVVDIELVLGTGGAKITVPRDATVDTEGLTAGWKTIRYEPRSPARADGPTIRFSGALGFGRLTIRHARR
ncbi:DUF1707 SHOCT-like domain-containing protein [Streptomyces sp. 796.1]|uniref:DUF1707 SHOCT-like domain-containing protein n=1 Tax=Streptomyces sp. 796.1 TaxID=3163029 RepID=UPI0039C997B7